MGCVISSSSSPEKKKKGRGRGSRRPPARRRGNAIIVPQLVISGGGGPDGYYNDRSTSSSSYDDSDDSSAVAFAHRKGHKFMGQLHPNSPAMVSDSWSFAVASPAMSLGSPVMFSEVWSKQGKRPSGGGGNDDHHQPEVIDEVGTEIELESEGEVSSSPERDRKGNDVGVVARRRKHGSLSDPTFMEAFIFA